MPPIKWSIPQVRLCVLEAGSCLAHVVVIGPCYCRHKMLLRGDGWWKGIFTDLMAAANQHFSLIVDLTASAGDSLSAVVALMLKEKTFSAEDPTGVAYMGLDANKDYVTLAKQRRDFELSKLFREGAHMVGHDHLAKTAAALAPSTSLARSLAAGVIKRCNSSFELLHFEDNFLCSLPRKVEDFASFNGILMDHELEELYETLLGTELWRSCARTSTVGACLEALNL